MARAAGSTLAVQSTPSNNIQGVIDTFAQTVALIEFLFCSVKFFLCIAEAPALSDQGPLTVKCSEPSVWGFFSQFYIVFKSLAAFLCFHLIING